MIETHLKALGLFGSDHTIQGIKVEDVYSSIQLYGLTHNMLDKCYDGAHCPIPGQSFSNNPFDVMENDDSYLTRKEIQLNKYLDLIDKAIENNTPIDFFFLQEIDIFTKSLSWDFETRRNQIVESFFAALKERGWNYEKTQSSDNCKPLITLYNNQTLNPWHCNFHIKDSRNNKNTAFEVLFEHIPTNRMVSLTNMHLDYARDELLLSQEISDILSMHSKDSYNDVLAIAGGDCNHPREQMRYAIGPAGLATALSKDDSGYVTTMYRSGTPNTIDSFFVSKGQINVSSHSCYFFNDRHEVKKVADDSQKLRKQFKNDLKLTSFNRFKLKSSTLSRTEAIEKDCDRRRQLTTSG